MRIILLISYCFAGCCAVAQQGDDKQARRIYTSLLNYYLLEQPRNVGIADSTSNIAISTDSFANILPGKFVWPGNMNLDSTWRKDLIEADRHKTILKTERFPITALDGRKISLINTKRIEANISAQFQKGIIEITPDYIQFSSVILIRNRAIVSVEKMTPELRGHRRLFFLERRKRKWVVVSYLLRSIS
jgi:hypothetical protein